MRRGEACHGPLGGSTVDERAVGTVGDAAAVLPALVPVGQPAIERAVAPSDAQADNRCKQDRQHAEQQRPARNARPPRDDPGHVSHLPRIALRLALLSASFDAAIAGDVPRAADLRTCLGRHGGLGEPTPAAKRCHWDRPARASPSRAPRPGRRDVRARGSVGRHAPGYGACYTVVARRS